ncbi:MAG: YqeG family HAD IIIA-type phosphatase [Coriobacteriia bacterium]|nr:YqeG family HAD IIIA-type phosphatase [Coriobacteriia bacterium]
MTLSPDHYLRAVSDIDLDALAAQGIDTLLIDLDNTLLPRDTSRISDEAFAWAAEIKSRGFRACLVSNNWHDRVFNAADSLGFELVSKAIKPLPFAFLIALKKTGSSRRRAAVIGDQLFTDILGGKMLGMKTIMVLPLSPSDLAHTLLLRRLERVVLAGRQPLP